jgi:hypothetical protein
MFYKINYDELSGKAKETYNFQKVSAVLADYGYATNWLNIDFESADFIATHFDGYNILKVQLKGRFSIYKKYIGKDIYICFPYKKSFYMIPHDKMVEIVEKKTIWLDSSSWKENGFYHSHRPSRELVEEIEKYKL